MLPFSSADWHLLAATAAGLIVAMLVLGLGRLLLRRRWQAQPLPLPFEGVNDWRDQAFRIGKSWDEIEAAWR